MEKKKILMIDDEVGLTTLVKSYLEKTGKYAVAIENDGSEGLKAAQATHPDLIILDIVMPEMDGTEVAALIKSDQNFKDTPIVFLTALLKENEAQDKSIIGGHPFMAKPVSMHKLVECVEKYIR